VINIALICTITVLVLACIVPLVICYFGCICTCCCSCCDKKAPLTEKKKDGDSVLYSVRSTRSQSNSGGSNPRSKKSRATAPERSLS
ncbi:hypothetical protein PFISCL1PPCAC_7915, partial [Pristionchus fissidentatus]